MIEKKKPILWAPFGNYIDSLLLSSKWLTVLLLSVTSVGRKLQISWLDVVSAIFGKTSGFSVDEKTVPHTILITFLHQHELPPKMLPPNPESWCMHIPVVNFRPRAFTGNFYEKRTEHEMRSLGVKDSTLSRGLKILARNSKSWSEQYDKEFTHGLDYLDNFIIILQFTIAILYVGLKSHDSFEKAFTLENKIRRR